MVLNSDLEIDLNSKHTQISLINNMKSSNKSFQYVCCQILWVESIELYNNSNRYARNHNEQPVSVGFETKHIEIWPIVWPSFALLHSLFLSLSYAVSCFLPFTYSFQYSNTYDPKLFCYLFGFFFKFSPLHILKY